MNNEQLLQKKWTELPSQYQTLQQMYGRNEEGCGATIGMMPRCDFSCSGCYLTEDANRIKPASVESIKKQLDKLRTYLGKWGNLQLTDGEVTLRDRDELIEIINYAHKVELIPMIMTHGDSFRRDPEFLYQLVRDTPLREVSFHIDSTQRGRFGEAYKYAKTEAELMPLREEFAELIRAVKKNTGRTLRAASTITITRDNIGEVRSILPWFLKNSDAFRLVSFLPLAQVGRTEGQLAGVSHEEIWSEIDKGLSSSLPQGVQYSDKSQWWMGHPGCNRFIFGYVLNRKGKTLFRRLSMAEDDKDRRFFEKAYTYWPGFTFRPLSNINVAFQLLKKFLSHPLFCLLETPKFLRNILKDLSEGSEIKLLRDLVSKKASLNRLTVVTHHFMDANELSTPLGKERLKACSFKVAHAGELISMCEMNALGKRQNFYNSLRQ